MKGGKYISISGAVVIVLLLISGASAVNVVKESKINDMIENQRNNVFIDPNIKLTKFSLPLLRKAIKQNTDQEDNIFLENLITLLEKNGKITSFDIKNIIKNEKLHYRGIYGFSRIRTLNSSDGYADSIPGYLLTALIGYFGPALIVRYGTGVSDEYGWHVEINNQKVNVGNGLILGWIGYVYSSIDGKLNKYFGLNGFGLLIIHK